MCTITAFVLHRPLNGQETGRPLTILASLKSYAASMVLVPGAPDQFE